MNGMDIVGVAKENDLVLLIDCNIKFHSQSSTVVNKASRLLGLMKWIIFEDLFLSLYK